MALDTSQFVLPRDVALRVAQKTQDTSAIAQLSNAEPMIFNDSENLVFNGQAEAEVVGEGQAKSAYNQTLTTVPGQRVKLQTTLRLTDEVQYADQDNRLGIEQAVIDDQARALGRALDYVVFHAINPMGGAALSGRTALTSSAVQVNEVSDAQKSLDNLESAVNETWTVNGLALSRHYANALRAYRNTLGQRLYDIPLNLQPGSVDGVPCAVSNTVSGAPIINSGVDAIIGDWNQIRWGIVRNITSQILTAGDPDGQGDLARNNQIAIRTEAMFGYAVIDPTAFAVLKGKTTSGSSSSSSK